MSLISTIGDELKGAMKSGDTEKRDTLRLLQSALKNAAIEARKEASAFTDAEVQSVVKKLVKQRQDSIEQYTAGNRMDLAEKEKKEVEILSPYLPQTLSREATRALVEKVLGEQGGATAKDMGKIMGLVMKEAGGQADGTLVREIVQERLSS